MSRTGYTGEDGFEIYFPDEESERVWNAVLEAGAPEGIAPIGLGARDTLRLEAGMPLYGHEIDREHNLIELVSHFGVSFKEEKGDWIGRDALAAIKENPRRQLVGITTDGSACRARATALFHGDDEVGAICNRRGLPDPRHEHRDGLPPGGLAQARPDRAHGHSRKAPGVRRLRPPLLLPQGQVSPGIPPSKTQRQRCDPTTAVTWTPTNGPSSMATWSSSASPTSPWRSSPTATRATSSTRDLPDVGRDIDQGETFGEIESVKAVSDLNAPVAGEIVEINNDIDEHLEVLSEDP